MSCGVGYRHGSDVALLWLWCRLAAAAPIQSLAWELSYALGAALKKKKKRGRDQGDACISHASMTQKLSSNNQKQGKVFQTSERTKLLTPRLRLLASKMVRL